MILQVVTLISIISVVLIVYVTTFFRDSLEGKPPRIKIMLVVIVGLVFCVSVVTCFPQVSFPSGFLIISALPWLFFSIFDTRIPRKIKISLLGLSCIAVGFVVFNSDTQTSQANSNTQVTMLNLRPAQ